MFRARRLLVAFAALMVLALLALMGRMAWLQSERSHAARDRQLRQSTDTTTLFARRGEVHDRHGRPLADSVQTLRLAVYPPNVTHVGGAERPAEDVAETVRAIVGFLAPRLPVEASDLARRLVGSKYAYLGPALSEPRLLAELEGARQTTLRRLDFEAGWQRVHPAETVGGNLIGFVDHAGKPVAGLERGLDSLLTGNNGEHQHRRDVGGRAVYTVRDEIAPALDGVDIRLTLDLTLQAMVEQELMQVMQEQRALGAAGVILDVTTGDVLALASVPNLDPSDTSARIKDRYRHRAVEDTYAPGSTLKPLMMATALEMGLVTPSMRIDCSASQARFGSRTIHDTKPQERSLSPQEILVYSSNIGMANIFTRLVPPDDGRNTALMAPVHDKLRAFGFGGATGLPLPFESAGSVSPLKHWTRNYTLVSVSFGMELAVTPLQMAAAIATLADGRYRQPRLVAAMRQPGADWQPTVRSAPRPVFRREHADLVRDWMVDVLAEGLHGDALVEGVLVAAKTGTAEDEANKPGENHSFVALAPADAPRLALVVMVQHPQDGRYSSLTTRPAALRALGRALKYLGISPGSS